MTLFFKNPIMMLIGGCTGALLMPIFGTKQKEKKVRKELSLEFRDALYGLVVSLRAGRSLEGAFEASLEDMSPASLPLLYEEWKTICGRIRIGVPAETALTDLARRSGIEEIRSFARSVEISKKAEGNITRILTNTIQLFLVTAAVVLLISLVICSVTVQRMTDPLKVMKDAAHKFARGEVGTRVTQFAARKDEIGELAVAFNAMADSLAQAEQKRSEFVANVSHELKTPMTTIAGFADGILDGTIPPDKERESLQVISSETRRLSRLVRRMLELSRLQSSERVAAQEQFDAEEVLLRVLVSLEAKITEKDLDVETDLPPGPVMVWGDPDAVTQVCYNLLDNAVKFSSPGGRLSLKITTRGGKAYIAIGNQGETIPADQLTHIFDRFHKADSSRSAHKEGVGLGLYIVKTILNTYKEDITVTSQEGYTEFTFTLSEV